MRSRRMSPAHSFYMNRRGTEPYARWCGRTAGAIPPPTRSDNHEIHFTPADISQITQFVTVRSCRYFGPEVAVARRSVRPVPDRACGSASVRANRVAMRFQCPTPFPTLAITPLRSASIAIWQALRTAPYRHDRTVTIKSSFNTRDCRSRRQRRQWRVFCFASGSGNPPNFSSAFRSSWLGREEISARE